MRIPIFLLLNFFSTLTLAEAHREPSVLMPARAVDDLQVVRDEGVLYRKDLFNDGFRVSLVGSGSKLLSHSWNFSDFAGKKSCDSESEGKLLLAYSAGNAQRALESCQDQLEGVVVSKDTLGHTLLCRYSCKKITLESLQGVFFENFVRYLEPNASRGLN